MKRFNVALAQTNPQLGDLHANLQDHLEMIQAAMDKGADMVVFPELSLTGYFLKDQVFELGLELDADPLQRLAQASSTISIMAGFVEKSTDGRFYNSLAFFEGGALRGVHRKVHLVSYGLFDEARDFAAGDGFHAIESRFGCLGPLICEDFWHMPSAYAHFLSNADVILVPSASPARGVDTSGAGLGSQRTWETILSSQALLYRTWVIYVGRTGWEDGIGFGGGSAVFDPWGQRIARIEGIETGLLVVELSARALERARVETPLRRDEKPWILASTLERHRAGNPYFEASEA